MGLLSGITGLFQGNAENLFKRINTPAIEDMRLSLDEYVQQGMLTPEQATVIMQDPSAFEQIMTDPGLRDAQMAALGGLQDVFESGGLDARSQARLNDIAKAEMIQQRGARDAIMSSAAQRGVAGSGLEFLNQMKNQQESANRQSARGLQVAADAEQRALDALMSSGNLAGSIRGQEFGEQARIAEAKDAIDRFNVANRNQTGMYNTGVRNDAQKFNLGERQRIYDANVDTRNKQQAFNKDLYQRNFDNQMAKASGQANTRAYDQQRQSKAVSDLEGGIGKILGGYV
jgi:hypothetical protein